MKIVAVTQRIDDYPERHETRDALDQNLYLFIIACGYLPVPVPNLSPEILKIWLRKINPDYFLLSGGNDVGQFKVRDTAENYILDHAEKNNRPVLGLCRGMQMMAVRDGGELKSVVEHVNLYHKITGDIKADVNSFHHQAVATDTINFEITARSSDGIIEAIRHKELPWQGWMWHPEREKKFKLDDINRVKALFK